MNLWLFLVDFSLLFVIIDHLCIYKRLSICIWNIKRWTFVHSRYRILKTYISTHLKICITSLNKINCDVRYAISKVNPLSVNLPPRPHIIFPPLRPPIWVSWIFYYNVGVLWSCYTHDSIFYVYIQHNIIRKENFPWLFTFSICSVQSNRVHTLLGRAISS